MHNFSIPAGLRTHSLAATTSRRKPGPDDVEDPDFPRRDNSDGPDSTEDPDFGRRDDGWSGPDGERYRDSDLYCSVPPLRIKSK